MTNIDRWTALKCAAVVVLAFAFQQSVRAQDDATATSVNTAAAGTAAAELRTANGNVPRLIKITGVATDPEGKPATGAVSLTFTLYKEQEGAALWTETQSLQLDSQGHYTVLLGAGSTEGLPLDLFASGNALWLGVKPELPSESELPRVLLVAVPYALKAADADTLGGKPASAYLLSATSSPGQATNANLAAALQSAQQLRLGLQPETSNANQNNNSAWSGRDHGTPDFIPIWTGRRTLGDSILFQASDNVGAGTQTPGARLDAVSTGIAVRGTSSGVSGAGVIGVSNATAGYSNGVYGQSASTSGSGLSGNATAASGYTSGVYGHSTSTNGTGVYGSSANWVGVGGMGATLGVWGDSATINGTGVAGYSDSTSGYGNGVYGQSASPNGAGMVGVNTASAGGAGVSGTIHSTSGAGIAGNATAASGYTNGVYGQSSSTSGYGVNGDAIATTGYNVGVYGQTESSSGYGVFGSANATGSSGAGGIGVIGINLGSNGSAGSFGALAGQGLILQGWGSDFAQVFSVDANGNLNISGNLTVAGSKSARVKLQDGQEVALYAVESPENWFEDFGTAQLREGAAEVLLEPGFLQTVDTAADYHVFLTPKGDCHGLYVATTTSAGFEVRELGGGNASIAFDYRIVAHRRGFENVRLQDVHLPQGPKDMQARFASMQSGGHMVAPPPPRVTIPVSPHPAD